MKFYLLYKNHGLYDPVLHDYEPIYDYEPDDSGRQSEPTEVVFEIQRFVEPNDIGSKLLELSDTPNNLSESRSLTSSPFVTPTKPYRPFSTEPLPEIPPLEDPIILNPNYRDEFGKTPIGDDPDYLLNPFDKDALGPNRYKLPISEQYDPDGTRFKQNTEVVEKLLKYEKHVKSLSKDLEVVDVTKETKVCDAGVERKESLSKNVSIKEALVEDVKTEKKGVRISEESVRKDSKSFKEEIEEESIREELQYIEKMRQEIDLEKIEETAMSVVDDSIERAVSVAEEIKKEIDEELSSSEQQEKSEVKYEKREESSEIIDKTQSKQETKEYAERKMSREERTETQDATQRIARKDVQQTESSEQFETEHGKMDVRKKSLLTEEYKQEEYRQEPRRESAIREGSEGVSEAKIKFKKAAKTVASSVKGEKSTAEQRAYTIGLQTIPNIRGTVHSSYHYDLLLRTFFIHLTDVMVALSRFILTQPAFSQLEQSVTETRYESGERDAQVRKSSYVVEKEVMKAQEAKKGTKQTRQLITPVPVEKKEVTVSQKIEKDVKIQEQKIEKKEVIKPVPVKAEQIEVRQEQKIEKEVVSEKKSGAEMAQRSDKKLTKEMTQKLGAVISEFETIAVEDAKEQMLMKSRRSRSRSQIEEEVAKESDPLEWLSKVDSRRTSQERTEMSKKEFSSGKVEKKSFVETKQETIHKKPKTPKQTYIAIVESHVYTNKDAIFEEHVTDISETSSIQSAEEVNTAFEAVETVSAENVAIESAVRELETAKIVEETHKLDKVIAKSAAVVQKHEEVVHDTKELIQEEFKKETGVQSTDIQEVIVQETKEIIEPVVEIKESKVEKVEKVAIDINKSLAIAESTEVSMLESAVELKKEVEEKVEKVAVDINESLAIAEATEVTTLESKAEFKDVELKTETVAVIEEEKIEEKVIETKPEVLEAPKPVEVVEITETIKIKPKEIKTVHDESAELKIVKIVPVDSVLSPEIIEVEDISELISKSVVSRVAVGDQVSIDASKEVSATSSIKETSSKSGKKESQVDLSSEISQVSSQSETSALKKGLAVSQKAESSSKSSDTQEASFTAKSIDRKLSLRTDLDRQTSLQSPPSSIDTPTPSTVPPTPVTDEYVFKLSLPLPKSRSATPVPRDSTPTPDDEDPNIVKKKLIPHIETTIERVVYDPPLPTPTGEPKSPVFSKPVLNGGGFKPVYSKPGLKGGAIRPVYIKPGLRGGGIRPVYRKPGLFGGADSPDYSKEEIREIERKSSLLASAIDETIKSIEEYKEEVGIDTKKEVKTQEYKEEKITKSYKESYSKEVKTESIQNGFQEIDTKIDEIMEQCNALVSITETPKTEDETQGIVTEVDEIENRKQSNEIETEPVANEEKPKEKAVKFENEVKIVEVENLDNKVADVEKKESIRVDIPVATDPVSVVDPVSVADPVPIILDPIPPTPVVEMKQPVMLQPTIVSEIPVIQKPVTEPERPDPLQGFRPVVFDPENLQRQVYQYPFVEEPPVPQEPRGSPYMTETGELIGTIQGIVDGLETPVMDEELAKELGKPGISEEKIATLISGEAEMLREAHVMGLSRVLSSHMHRADDSSVDFQTIKPMIGTLKDSEVIKALNEEIAREKAEQKKKEEKRWTTFLQKPKRPVPKAKFGYQGWTQDEEIVAEPYKVKIVKQAKPKVAPDYKPEDFETGPLPWEERANTEASLPPVEPEEPILIPEVPEFLEAVDPLKESEVPDLEDTGIPLPPPREPTPPPIVEEQPEPEAIPEEVEEIVAPEEQKEEKTETKEDMENRMAEQLVKSVQSMVDPNASLDQQLAQMRAQLAALAQLPEVIQQSLELVSKQLSKISHQEAHVEATQESQNYQQAEETHEMQTIQEVNESENEATQNEAQKVEEVRENLEQQQQMQQQQLQQQQQQQMLQQQEKMRITEEEIRNEKQRKEQERIEHESRLVKQHPTPRSAKPKRVFGPLDPEERMAVVLPGGRRWKNSKDVYDEQAIKEMFETYSEVIKGNAIGFESEHLPYDKRINFMKYEKPPVSLDHLKHSEVYKLIHDMDSMPPKRVEMRTPVMSEADYRERCRSMTPNVEKKHLNIPQQFHP